jgi:hypothetical protein
VVFFMMTGDLANVTHSLSCYPNTMHNKGLLLTLIDLHKSFGKPSVKEICSLAKCAKDTFYRVWSDSTKQGSPAYYNRINLEKRIVFTAIENPAAGKRGLYHILGSAVPQSTIFSVLKKYRLSLEYERRLASFITKPPDPTNPQTKLTMPLKLKKKEGIDFILPDQITPLYIRKYIREVTKTKNMQLPGIRDKKNDRLIIFYPGCLYYLYIRETPLTPPLRRSIFEFSLIDHFSSYAICRLYETGVDNFDSLLGSFFSNVVIQEIPHENACLGLIIVDDTQQIPDYFPLTDHKIEKHFVTWPKLRSILRRKIGYSKIYLTEGLPHSFITKIDSDFYPAFGAKVECDIPQIKTLLKSFTARYNNSISETRFSYCRSPLEIHSRSSHLLPDPDCLDEGIYSNW